MKDWMKKLWCRAVYGHVMVRIGTAGNPKVMMYMCARCLLCQNLSYMGTEDNCK